MTTAPVVICRNCTRRRATRPRRLCSWCYSRPKIRERYGPVSKYGRRGIGHRSGPLGEPTTAAPGSAEKLEVMVRRAEAGRSLWHPGDADHGGERHPGEVAGPSPAALTADGPGSGRTM